MVQMIRQAIEGSPFVGAPGEVMLVRQAGLLRPQKPGLKWLTSGTNAEKLGYLGLGMMGFPMTRRLINAGYDVTVWNRSPARPRPWSRPAPGCRMPRDVASTAGIIFMCLTDAAAVEAVAFGPDGLATCRVRQARGRLLLDPPGCGARHRRALENANGMGWIDAPVSGGTKGAEEGTLAVMAGGDAADIERVRPYILAMARRLTHMGPTGAGQTTKLCNQVIVGCAMAVLAEAARLAVNAGIDANRLPEALAGGFADFIPLQLFVPRMVQAIYSPPAGHIATMLKDLDTVIDVAATPRARYRCRRWPPNCSGWPRRLAPTPMHRNLQTVRFSNGLKCSREISNSSCPAGPRLVPGIHVHSVSRKNERGWPGQARP